MTESYRTTSHELFLIFGLSANFLHFSSFLLPSSSFFFFNKMAISISPLPESTIPSAPKRNLDPQFGRVVEGIDLANLSDSELSSIQELLYAHSVLVFPNTKLSSEKQYQLTKSFDPTSENYGHKGRQKQSILHPDLKTIPDVPQVQLIGNGLVKEHEGLVDARLKHPHHKTFHKTVVSEQDEKAGKTRFYRLVNIDLEPSCDPLSHPN